MQNEGMKYTCPACTWTGETEKLFPCPACGISDEDFPLIELKAPLVITGSESLIRHHNYDTLYLVGLHADLLSCGHSLRA